MNEHRERVTDAISTWEAICDYEYQADRFENDDLDALRIIMLEAEHPARLTEAEAQLAEAAELLERLVALDDSAPTSNAASEGLGPIADAAAIFLDKVSR